MELNGGGAQSEDAGTRASGISLEVDRDVDFHGAQSCRHLRIALCPHIDEAIECGFQPHAHVALIIGPEGEGIGLEFFPIPMLEHARHQEGGGMRVKIGREIGDADLVVAIALASPQRLRRFGIEPARENLRSVQLLLWRC